MESVFNKINYTLFVIGLIVIGLGYVIIANNTVYSSASTKVGPLMLFIGYCVIIPVSIIYKQKK
tara:strand:- start:277 stop:468 length:192 start_codon:yes stop_codon:yes gene_type:complete